MKRDTQHKRTDDALLQMHFRLQILQQVALMEINSAARNQTAKNRKFGVHHQATQTTVSQ